MKVTKAHTLSEEQRPDFISIAVADSTRIHTQLLADAMRGDPSLQVVASGPSSQELLDAVSRVPIDVAVISYNLDDEPARGLEVLRQMRTMRPAIKGVVLLDSARPDHVLECFRAGAKGIFSKHEHLESLSKCIHCVYDGQVWARSDELELVLEALANSPIVRATNHEGLELLSDREREVVHHLAAGMTNREIASAMGLSRHTVKNYLFRIFDKVGVSSRTELLYLTMNRSQSSGESSGANGNDLMTIMKAAEGGLPWAQLQLAQHFSGAKEEFDAVKAHMWFALCQRSISETVQQVESGRQLLESKMSAQQIAEAERLAAEWHEGREKQSESALMLEQRIKAAGANRT